MGSSCDNPCARPHELPSKFRSSEVSKSCCVVNIFCNLALLANAASSHTMTPRSRLLEAALFGFQLFQTVVAQDDAGALFTYPSKKHAYFHYLTNELVEVRYECPAEQTAELRVYCRNNDDKNDIGEGAHPRGYVERRRDYG